MSKKDNKQVAKGFDRDIDYQTMKNKLILEYKKIIDQINNLDIDIKSYISKRRFLMHKSIYLLVSMIQLRNGSRVIEACKAIRLFLNNDDLDEKVIVKIAKSESIKYKKDTKEEYVTKPRYRKMMFPLSWIECNFLEDIKFYLKKIENKSLKQRVLDYLIKYFKCNTHSLRYAYINYMLYDRKEEMSKVAKFVGHVDTMMLVRYTQLKNIEEMFDMDM